MLDIFASSLRDRGRRRLARQLIFFHSLVVFVIEFISAIDFGNARNISKVWAVNEQHAKSEIVVLDVAGARAIVIVGSAVDASGLNDLGFVLTDHIGERPIHDMGDRAYFVKELINMGVVFSGGREWSPAEVDNYLRGQGRVNTKFRKIV